MRPDGFVAASGQAASWAFLEVAGMVYSLLLWGKAIGHPLWIAPSRDAPPGVLAATLVLAVPLSIAGRRRFGLAALATTTAAITPLLARPSLDGPWLLAATVASQGCLVAALASGMARFPRFTTPSTAGRVSGAVAAAETLAAGLALAAAVELLRDARQTYAVAALAILAGGLSSAFFLDDRTVPQPSVARATGRTQGTIALAAWLVVSFCLASWDARRTSVWDLVAFQVSAAAGALVAGLAWDGLPARRAGTLLPLALLACAVVMGKNVLAGIVAGGALALGRCVLPASTGAKGAGAGILAKAAQLLGGRLAGIV
ncbi:MAG: hypothetical protein U0166_18410 [Acidobacteriota bacterium]